MMVPFARNRRHCYLLLIVRSEERLLVELDSVTLLHRLQIDLYSLVPRFVVAAHL